MESVHFTDKKGEINVATSQALFPSDWIKQILEHLSKIVQASLCYPQGGGQATDSAELSLAEDKKSVSPSIDRVYRPWALRELHDINLLKFHVSSTDYPVGKPSRLVLARKLRRDHGKLVYEQKVCDVPAEVWEGLPEKTRQSEGLIRLTPFPRQVKSGLSASKRPNYVMFEP